MSRSDRLQLGRANADGTLPHRPLPAPYACDLGLHFREPPGNLDMPMSVAGSRNWRRIRHASTCGQLTDSTPRPLFQLPVRATVSHTIEPLPAATPAGTYVLQSSHRRSRTRLNSETLAVASVKPWRRACPAMRRS